jgi:Glycosyl hydrolase family 99
MCVAGPALLAVLALALAACGQGQPKSAGELPCARHGSAFGRPCIPVSASPSAPAPGPASAAPVFAYYYMWMQGAYWSTAKLDHPAQPFPGNYNSADPAVISWQIQQAKAAGITGFIVSWKNNATYQKILPEVESVANQDDFKLAMEYETLGASKKVLPVAEISADLTYFVAHYASNPAWYRVNGKPLATIDDSNDYSPAHLAAITAPVRPALNVLQDVSTVALYNKYAAYTDGDAYYWSSANPATNPHAAADLDALGAAVHATHGTWIAPFAPGYNSTLIGGHVIVPRDDGASLRTEYATAAGSSPDILGLISWNEWTENTYVEPSVSYGFTYVNVLKSLVNPVSRIHPRRST